VGGQSRHLARRHLLLRIALAPGVNERRLRQAELARPFRHQGAEGLLGAGDAFGQRDRRVIARGDDQAADQVLDADLAVDLGKHRRTARGSAAVAPGMHRNRHDIVELQPALDQFVKDDLGGQDLRRRGRRHQSVGILLEQHRAGVIVDEDRERRGRLEHLRLHDARSGQRQEQTDEWRNPGETHDAHNIRLHGTLPCRPRSSVELKYVHRVTDKSIRARSGSAHFACYGSEPGQPLQQTAWSHHMSSATRASSDMRL